MRAENMKKKNKKKNRIDGRGRFSNIKGRKEERKDILVISEAAKAIICVCKYVCACLCILFALINNLIQYWTTHVTYLKLFYFKIINNLQNNT